MFGTVGLCLILYCLFVLLMPLLLNDLIEYLGSDALASFIPDLSIEDAKLSVTFISLVLGTLLPFALLMTSNGIKFKDFMGKANTNIRDVVINFVVFFAVAALSIFVTMMIAQNINIPGEIVSSIGIAINTEYISSVTYVVAFIFVTPILEEFAFRGVLLSSLSKYGKYFAVIISSFIYALAHGSFVEMIPSFIMGIFLSKMAIKYESIRPCIAVHFFFNLFLYGLFMIPDELSLYMEIALGVMLILALVLVVTKEYNGIAIKRAESTSNAVLVFFATTPVILAIVLFVVHSVLLMIL